MALTLSGGVETTFTSGAVNYKSHTYTSSGQLTVTGTGTQAAQILVIGGGGGGSRGGGGETSDVNFGNGGGAGGLYYTGGVVITTTFPVWDIAVGPGGRGGSILAGAANGGTSSFAQRSNPATASVTITTWADGTYIQLTGSVAGRFYITGSTTQVDSPPNYYVVSASGVTATTSNLAAKINSLVSTFNIIAAHPGGNLNLTASIGGTAGNSFRFVTGSTVTSLQGGLDAVLTLTGSYGGYGGQPGGGVGASGGGSYPTGAAAIFADSGSAGGNQLGRSGAGGGGATTTGSNSSVTVDPPFAIWNGGNGGAGKAYALQNGTTSFYAAGGGGGGFINVGPGAGGTGGSGIGGDGGSGVKGAGKNGVANTGAGGGGGALSEQSGNWGEGGVGGSGIVIITYTV